MKLIKLASGVSVLLVVFGVGLLPYLTRAQTPAPVPTGKVDGVVLDVNDARIANATITIENKDTKLTAKSRDDGIFSVSVPAGVYTITAEAAGFQKFSNSPFTVKADETRLISIHMKVAASVGLLPAGRR